jgi:indole-3-glycerol phosphate synthase
MKDLLTQIMAERRRDAAAAKRRVALRKLLLEAEKRGRHSLVDRLRGTPGTRIVAEVKKASPSAGLLRSVYEPAVLAAEYEQAGAVGISVLTEPRHFHGWEADLREVRAAVEVPILRKDFLSDPYQLAEAAAWGADVVLLIVAGLDPEQCVTLHQEALEVGLETVVEIHDLNELDVALACEGAVIGVNSRDLKTLKTDLGTARDLASVIPAGRLCIAESGIRKRADIAALQDAGYDGFLIGETLLRARSPGQELRKLRGAGRKAK